MQIQFSEEVDQELKKIKQKDQRLLKQIEKQLALFQENPRHPSLRLHKLSGELNELWSISISKNIRKQITKEMIDSFDKIILVMDNRDLIPDYLVDNPKVIRWDVLDPKGQSLEFTRQIKDQIKDLISANF